MSRASYRVLMVCMGNICRSPTAEGVLRSRLAARGLSARVDVDSAGTHGWHEGAPPDYRAQRHAARRGYDLSSQRSRALRITDFERFDLVLAMDSDNIEHLGSACPREYRHKVRRLTEFARTHRAEDVPDPYQGEGADFERVLDLIEDACDGLVDHLSIQLAARRTEPPAR